MTTEQALNYLGISPNTLRKYRQLGRIKATPKGKTFDYDEQSVEAFNRWFNADKYTPINQFIFAQQPFPEIKDKYPYGNVVIKIEDILVALVKIGYLTNVEVIFYGPKLTGPFAEAIMAALKENNVPFRKERGR